MKFFGVLLVCAFAVACRTKEDSTGAPMVSASAVSTPEAIADPSSPAAIQSAARERHHRCPTELPNTTTVATDIDGGVQLTITGDDPKVVAEIRSRTMRAIDLSKRIEDHPGRNGEHRSGPCAAVVRGAKAESKDIDRGIQLTLMATPTIDAEHVRSEVRDRLVKR